MANSRMATPKDFGVGGYGAARGQRDNHIYGQSDMNA